jgi:hypothetical protein
MLHYPYKIGNDYKLTFNAATPTPPLGKFIEATCVQLLATGS